MPTDYYFGYYFYSPRGRFEPCGMFSLPHIISVIVCIVLIALVLVLTSKKIDRNKLKCCYKITFFLLVILETIKIIHSIIYGDYYLDAWFPLSYCGLFIFALGMAGYGNGRIEFAGETYITYGCPIAGVAFLMFPTTSLMDFPVWHFFSLYSLLFHSLMIYFGVLLLLKEKKLMLNKYLCYICFVVLFSLIAIGLNVQYNSNLMNLREPYNIPIEFLQNLYNNTAWGYTIVVLGAYCIIPPLIALLTGKFKDKN